MTFIRVNLGQFFIPAISWRMKVPYRFPERTAILGVTEVEHWGKAWGGSSVQAIASRGSVNSIGDGIDPPYSHNPGLFKCIMSGTCLDERCLDLCLWFGVILIQHIWKSVESSMPEWEAEQPQHGIQKSSSLTTWPPFKSLAECHKEDRVTVIGLQQTSEDIFSVKTTSKHLIESGHFLPWLSVL